MNKKLDYDECDLSINMIIDEFGMNNIGYKNIGEELLLFEKQLSNNLCEFLIIRLKSFGGTNSDGSKIELLENYGEVFIHGKIYFDGIRHLYFGYDFEEYPESNSNNYGYMNYADIELIKTALDEIQLLESKYIS